MTRTSDNTEKAVSTDVLIGGKVYSLAGADAEHLQRVAALLNSKLVEVRGTAGYKNMDPEYRELLLNLNLADEYFKVREEADRYQDEAASMENELYTARHDLVSMKLKLENALKQQDVLERRVEEWKSRYEELKGEQGSSRS